MAFRNRSFYLKDLHTFGADAILRKSSQPDYNAMDMVSAHVRVNEYGKELNRQSDEESDEPNWPAFYRLVDVMLWSQMVLWVMQSRDITVYALEATLHVNSKGDEFPLSWELRYDLEETPAPLISLKFSTGDLEQMSFRDAKATFEVEENNYDDASINVVAGVKNDIFKAVNPRLEGRALCWLPHFWTQTLRELGLVLRKTLVPVNPKEEGYATCVFSDGIHHVTMDINSRMMVQASAKFDEITDREEEDRIYLETTVEVDDLEKVVDSTETASLSTMEYPRATDLNNLGDALPTQDDLKA